MSGMTGAVSNYIQAMIAYQDPTTLAVSEELVSKLSSSRVMRVEELKDILMNKYDKRVAKMDADLLPADDDRRTFYETQFRKSIENLDAVAEVRKIQWH